MQNNNCLLADLNAVHFDYVNLSRNLELHIYIEVFCFYISCGVSYLLLITCFSSAFCDVIFLFSHHLSTPSTFFYLIAYLSLLNGFQRSVFQDCSLPSPNSLTEPFRTTPRLFLKLGRKIGLDLLTHGIRQESKNYRNQPFLLS